MNVDFEREKLWWNAKAAREEQDGCDESINRELRWREIQRHLDGVDTILEVGGGTGVFSVPLARQGFSVTHLDLSPAMLEIARQKAENLTNIQFVLGNSTDLSQFEDRSFDLVLNMDGAVSFCGFDADRAILESCRVTKKKMILTVSHRSMMVGNWISSSISATGRIAPAVHAMLERGEWRQEEFPENAQLAKGCTLDYFGPFKAFLPGELKKVLNESGLIVQRLGGLGSLAYMCNQETIQRVTQDVALFSEFCDLCERYDREVLPEGPGTSARAGLIAVAQRPEYLMADDWGLSW